MALDLTTAIGPDSEVLTTVGSIVSSDCQTELSANIGGKIYTDNFEEYFGTCSCLRGDAETFDGFENTLDSRFCEAFSTIKGYHATRIVDEQGFRNNGIVKLSAELLGQITNTFFDDEIDDGDINSSLGQIEIPDYDKRVFLFWHKDSATTPGYDHYLKAGPEVFGNHNFKTETTKSTGRPCIIHCDVPTGIITPEMRKCIWYYLIVSSIEFAAGTFNLESNLGTTFSTSENVPPNAITQFEYLTTV